MHHEIQSFYVEVNDYHNSQLIINKNNSFPNWVYVVLSRVKTLCGLGLVKELNDDQTKYQISDDLIREDERLDDLDEQFRIDINWEQKRNGLVSLINNT